MAHAVFIGEPASYSFMCMSVCVYVCVSAQTSKSYMYFSELICNLVRIYVTVNPRSD